MEYLKQKNNFDELAPCGVFCGACPSYNKTCLGCASDNKNQKRQSKWGCKIRVCCYDKMKLKYCIDCKEYPCNIYRKKLLSTHENDPRFTYRFEIPYQFPKIKSMGIENYYKYQIQRWKCDTCEGTIRFYNYTCDNCGKKLLVQ
ncbi:MAG: DUF3795 domain-containing protein [Mariniphaga sp.]|nr:DUF3795 domain-containing protein [Mariniphaga sp.]